MKINDVAELVEVSASTLRYWEKKLDLDVPRDELGSRTFNEKWNLCADRKAAVAAYEKAAHEKRREG